MWRDTPSMNARWRRCSWTERRTPFGSAPGLPTAGNVSHPNSTDVIQQGGSAKSSWDAGSRRHPYAGRAAVITVLRSLKAKLEYGGVDQKNYTSNIKKWINLVALWLMRSASNQVASAVLVR